MLCKATILIGSQVEAAGGAIGTVKDVYFDDASWKVRYLVVDTGSWLTGRKVLLAPAAVTNFSEVNRVLTTGLSREQVAQSPDVDSHRTVTRQEELNLHAHYGWIPYWETGYVWPSPFAFPVPNVGAIPYERVGTSPLAPGSSTAAGDDTVRREIAARLQPQDEDARLGSFQELRAFGLRATDGDIGEVKDLFVNPEDWQITHLVADAKKWWPGGDVVIDVSFVDAVVWEDDMVAVEMTKEQVKNSPPYDADAPFSDDYLLGLSGYYMALTRPSELAAAAAREWSIPPSGE
jgi:sporulation protein YlmC with PRC-barrel domain